MNARTPHELLHDGRLAEAARGFRQLLKLNPQDVDALVDLSRLSIVLGQLTEAQVLLDRALRIEPAHARGNLVRGLLAEATGDASAAVNHYERAVQLAPQDYLGRFNLGRALGVLGRHREAQDHLQYALRLRPQATEASQALAICRKEAGDLGGSITAFAEAIKNNPAYLDGYLALADLLCEAKRFTAATRVLEQANSLWPRSLMILDKTVAVAIHQGDLNRALDLVEREIEIDPTHVKAYLDLSTLCQLGGDVARAEWACLQLREHAPGLWRSYYHLGNIYDSVGLEDQAEAAYRQAIELSADSVWKPRCNLGYMLCGRHTEEAVREGTALLKHAVDHSPAGAIAPRYNLGLVYLNQARDAEAAALLAQVRDQLSAKSKLRPRVEEALAIATERLR